MTPRLFHSPLSKMAPIGTLWSVSYMGKTKAVSCLSRSPRNQRWSHCLLPVTRSRRWPLWRALRSLSQLRMSTLSTTKSPSSCPNSLMERSPPSRARTASGCSRVLLSLVTVSHLIGHLIDRTVGEEETEL